MPSVQRDRGGELAGLLVPRVESFLDPGVDDDEGGQRISPPEAEEGVEHEADEHRRCERAVDDGDTRLGQEHRVAESLASDVLSPGQKHHRDDGGREPANASE
jgi:hypothetical protein